MTLTRTTLAAAVLAMASAAHADDTLISEGFNDIGSLAASGWVLKNESLPIQTLSSEGSVSASVCCLSALSSATRCSAAS